MTSSIWVVTKSTLSIFTIVVSDASHWEYGTCCDQLRTIFSSRDLFESEKEHWDQRLKNTDHNLWFQPMPVNGSQGDNPFRENGTAANNYTNSRHQLFVKEKKSGHGVCR